jgi:5-oxopent-3-ene-1,2,5-tricarboxylate decarboxylase/2-hydroxyhepta-2,4-diene-1,7-dioate isomerase
MSSAADDLASHAARITSQFGAEVATALGSVSTATLASQLRKRGFDGCILDGVATTSRGVKMIGFARTVSYLPLREDLLAAKTAGFNAQKQAIERLEPGDVLVIGARGVHEAGTIGDILALRAQQRGAVGIVTDGAVRDAEAVDILEIPTYSVGRSPAVLSRRHLPWAVDVAVACAGTLVEPGDLLVGDDDGVVLLPTDAVAEIAIAAVAQEREEQFVLEQVLAGESVDGLYPMNATWRARYDAARAIADRDVRERPPG